MENLYLRLLLRKEEDVRNRTIRLMNRILKFNNFRSVIL